MYVVASISILLAAAVPALAATQCTVNANTPCRQSANSPNVVAQLPAGFSGTFECYRVVRNGQSDADWARMSSPYSCSVVYDFLTCSCMAAGCGAPLLCAVLMLACS